LEYELQALRNAHITFEVNSGAWAQRVLQLTFEIGKKGPTKKAVATFPDFYPEFRVSVDAEPLGLSHHQNPIGGNICLLGRGAGQWQPSMTLAQLLTEQLPRLIATGVPSPDVKTLELEDPQGEPFSAYYPYERSTSVLVDGAWTIPDNVFCGTLSIGMRHHALACALQVAVLEVRGEHREVWASADSAICDLYPIKLTGRWIRKDEPLMSPSPNPAFDKAAIMLTPPVLTSWMRHSIRDATIKVLGIIFPEETGHRKSGQGWVFGVEAEERVRKKTKRWKHRGYYARPMYAGRDDMSARIPTLSPLRQKTVVVFGLGTLGAPAALEFARGGVGELRLIDHDHVDAGPTVRWPIGLSAVGRPKTEVIKEFIDNNYPYTRVSTNSMKIGNPRSSGEVRQDAMIDRLLADASLVFDATAELDVQRLLSGLAATRRLPYVAVVGKPGAWGGTVFRHLPGKTEGCWNCLQWAQQEGGSIPSPAADPEPGLQPLGCGDVTFTGTSFDMSTIGLDAVRKAVGTLCGPNGGYPDSDWDVAVISLRNQDGSVSAPSWATFKLRREPRCGCSNQ
jgi:molybdopterin/thiamine biosynthesis adenylyltransferase